MADDLRTAINSRVVWFYETQLRDLNLDTFKEITADDTNPRRELFSEELHSAIFTGGASGTLAAPIRVHLDTRKPIWTADDKDRHGAFAATLLGRVGDWLGAREPRRIAGRVHQLRDELEASEFASRIEPALADFERTAAPYPTTQPATAKEHVGEPMGRVISRAELAGLKPWLIPELYNPAAGNPAVLADWVATLERYLDDFEAELSLATAGAVGARPGFDASRPDAYGGFIAQLLAAATTHTMADAVEVRVLEKDEKGNYLGRHSFRTNDAPFMQTTEPGPSRRLSYWSTAMLDPLRECVALKPNADMGLCQLVRLLYLYGTLPAQLGGGQVPPWRQRKPPDTAFARFLARLAGHEDLRNDSDLAARFQAATSRLRAVLEATAANPWAPDPSWSPLAGEILKQGLLSYKFWLDEQPRALGNNELNKVKLDLGFGGEVDKEAEFWSENHYIMFASSEYLLGQLWENDEFHAGGAFAKPGEDVPTRTGAERRDRGRARVLKWLNNRLMFGWTEFNSSGYYREHLWALLNLVDFALDSEVRTKATMAVDLLLFDVLRFSHRGTMGAAGGRSQFSSKSHGFDNGLTDIVELLLGVKGVFKEGNSQIGASFASSTYRVPEVLLEIGAHPPDYPFTDRSRVSISFDESPKYGITWSLKSKAKDSVFDGYASKRRRHFPHLDAVNRDIARLHDGYGAREDDTVFFWGMSAFLNKQIVRNTQDLVRRFGLDKAPAFATTRMLVKYVIPLAKGDISVAPDLIREYVHPVAAAPLAPLYLLRARELHKEFWAALNAEDYEERDEDAADMTSVFLEGSTRTRANILTYRSPGAMLSTVQSFRPGQVNFQSSIQQATLNGALNVFVTTGLWGFDLPDSIPFVGGLLAGGAFGLPLGPIGALTGGVLGASTAMAQERKLYGTNPLSDDGVDGPDWWTGYWSLPRAVQHGGAAIMTADFHALQEFLADAGSHAWIPKEGFAEVREQRTSAYDDANFPLLDIGQRSKGVWFFGNVTHNALTGSEAEPEEGYVGVFSNTRPAWLTKEDEPYVTRLQRKTDAIDALRDAAEDLRDEIEDEEDQAKRAALREQLAAADKELAKLKRLWRNPPDLFAERDWAVEGANVWIVQIGSRSEFGSFENFMDRVSAARVRVDDAGTLECSYDIPRPGGGSDRLRMVHDGSECDVNGKSIQTDLYPRFENPFVRGGRVEWGQRAYRIEWKGKSLLHEFGDFTKPVRQEQPRTDPEAAETITALVMYLRTGDEAMETRTVARATVEIGCNRVTTDQVVAAGPMAKGTVHDAEWVFFDRSARRSPDMTISVTHPASGGDPFDLHLLDPLDPFGDPLAYLGPLALLDNLGEPEWEASFSLKALMGDQTLRECSVPFGSISVEGDRRSTGPLPFVVRMSTWTPWRAVPGDVRARHWLLAQHASATLGWPSHHDLLLRDDAGELWHKRAGCGMSQGVWMHIDQVGAVPTWRGWNSWVAVSDRLGRVTLFVIDGGRLRTRSTDGDGVWRSEWRESRPATIDGFLQKHVPLESGATVAAVPAAAFSDGPDLWIAGSDGALHIRRKWQPGEDQLWERVEPKGFQLLPGAAPLVLGDDVLVRSTEGGIWMWGQAATVLPSWHQLASPGFAVVKLAAAQLGDGLVVGALAADGRVSFGVHHMGDLEWRSTHSSDGWKPRHDADLVCLAVDSDEVWLVTTGADGTVRSASLADPIWRPVGTAEQPARSARTAIAATSRVPGLVEVIIDDEDGLLAWTWWS